MEIAISGIVIIFLLLPGISFNKGFYSGEFSRQYLSNDFYSLFINTLFPSAIIYFIAFPFSYFLFGYKFDFEILLGIISSNDELVKNSIQKINEFILQLILFQIIINILSFFLGIFIRNKILKYSLDAKNSILRFNNIWHYLISARFLQYNNILINDSPEDVDLTFIDALVNINDNTFIYTGILIDYQLGKDGTLDLLIITKAQRKLVTGNDNGDYKDIRGNYLILKYSDLINVNFSFIQFDETLDTHGNIIEVSPRIIH